MSATTSRGEQILNRLTMVMRHRLPPGITPDYFDGFVRTNRRSLVAVLDEQLEAANLRKAKSDTGLNELPELWTPSARTAANLKAMAIAAKGKRRLSKADRQALALYSGWGGLSIEKVKGLFPKGFPKPESRGLIHEYYTPRGSRRRTCGGWRG